MTPAVKRNLIFILLLLLGSTYFAFLFSVFHHTVSGFFMQVIFLYEQYVAHQLHLTNYYQPEFWLNLITGPIILYFVFSALRALFSLVSQIIATHQFVTSLRITSRRNYLLFTSSQPQVFTAGFIHPRVYVSTSLFRLCSPSEFRSILLHESMHAHSRDPLKQAFVNFLAHSLPPFPGKNHLFALYDSYVEITCDHFAQSKLSTTRPLVSALSKLLDQPVSPSPLVSAFSASSARIHSLTQGKVPKLQSFYYRIFGSITLLVLLSFAVNKSSLFYNCDHLFECFKLVTHHQVVPLTHQNCNIPQVSYSDPCISHFMP